MTVANAIVTIRAQARFGTFLFHVSKIPTVGVLGLRIRVLNSVKHCPTVFKMGCTIFHLHQEHITVPIAPRPGTHLVFSILLSVWRFLVLVVKMLSHCSFNLLSFITNEMLSFPACLLNICISLIKCSNILPVIYQIICLFIKELGKFFIYVFRLLVLY